MSRPSTLDGRSDSLVSGDRGLPAILVGSATTSAPAGAEALRHWLAERDRDSTMTVSRADLADLRDWHDEQVIRHRTGRFFTVEGLDVRVEGGGVGHWRQPIICQFEIGVLGILAACVDGVQRFLMQAKAEPGNPRGHQLSPTVQATRSNFTRAHGGRSVPYLRYFVDAEVDRVLVDVLQSEQGSWFLRKRNRNMVVEVDPGIEVLEGFRWCTLAEIHAALAVEDLVNMDARTVLSCLPFHGSGLLHGLDGFADDFTGALVRSLAGTHGGVHHLGEILGAVTAARAEAAIKAERVPLAGLPAWHRRDGAITHESGAFFDVIGVDVKADGREVGEWSQPMFAARGVGLVCFLVTVLDGVLHVLVQLRREPGFLDTVELAPTVQCTPSTYERLPELAKPPFLDVVSGADPSAFRFDTVMSEEGGRFHHTRTRYVVLEVDDVLERPGFHWMTVDQLTSLLRHSHYVDVQARSLLPCLQALACGRAARTA
ncbi:NDP-hexose 2,3-dehydratase family protein [Amycolatopsis sp. QT-25]|uniref:NDP-hexose 2,3-dehydratase family protein n=1 Tax=Amycolatopsis sp. QT-25 TaxID=3034022 RepID=UPI0023EBFED7|nr:NDP-hexose 2,3-dehydratase family protein [Amycolatopsis sp. QT-25]WET76799.1 NDP-hexose 2,3-dehydratase family protein [Amycolatopsis sp. QT-25]